MAEERDERSLRAKGWTAAEIRGRDGCGLHFIAVLVLFSATQRPRRGKAGRRRLTLLDARDDRSVTVERMLLRGIPGSK